MWIARKNMLLFYVTIFYFSTSEAFPFFSFHKSEIKNVSDAIGSKADAVNAPAPQMSSLRVPTEPMKTSAEANLDRVVNLIKSDQNIREVIQSAIKDNQPSIVSLSAAIVEVDKDLKEKPKITVLRFPNPLQTFLGDNIELKGDPDKMNAAQSAVVPSAGAAANNNGNSVAFFKVGEALDGGTKINDALNRNNLNNADDLVAKVEQTTLSEIWLELNKILSGDVPEEMTQAPLAAQLNPQDQMQSGTFTNSRNRIIPEIRFGNEQNQPAQTIDLTPGVVGIKLGNTLGSENYAPSMNYQQQPSANNDIPLADLAPSLSITNLQPQIEQQPVITASVQNLFPQQEIPEPLPQALPVVRSHSFPNLATSYDSERINAPLLEKPNTPWYYKYVKGWEKPTESVKELLDDFKAANI